MPLVQTDLDELVNLLEAHPEWQLPLLRLLMSKQNVRELLLQDQELLLTLRGLIIGEELARLPAQVEEVKQTTLQAVGQLTREVAETKQIALHTAERVDRVEREVTETKQIALHTAERVDRVEREVSNLNTTTTKMEAWQRGEDGRRRGEELEKRVRRQAIRLFNGGDGGTPEDAHVRARLREWLAGRQALDQRIRDIDDPTLADLIWWKGERVAVVETSVKVNGEDVRRARLRAETLRAAGVDALPIVIGEEWATLDCRALAEQEGVAWKVGDEISETLIQFRLLAE